MPIDLALGTSIVSGGGRQFSPTNLTNLALWMDAGRGVSPGTADVAVDSWTSVEGNAYAFSQSTEAKKPIFRSAPTGFNGRPALDFDGTDDLLRLGSAPLNSTAGLVCVVVRMGSVADDTVFSSSDEATTNENLQPIYIFDTNITVISTVAGSADQVESATVLSTNTTYLLTCASNGTAYELKINGADQTEVVIAGTNSGDWFGDNTGLDNMVIGALKRTSEAGQADMHIAEIIAYSEDKTAAEKLQLENYLNSKYAIF